MRPDAPGGPSDQPPGLRDRTPPPAGLWVRVVGGIVGATAGAAVGVAGVLATCLELDCLGVYVAGPVGAVLGAPIGFVLTLDLQRWWVRRRSERTT